jgi:hypothetical protein
LAAPAAPPLTQPAQEQSESSEGSESDGAGSNGDGPSLTDATAAAAPTTTSGGEEEEEAFGTVDRLLGFAFRGGRPHYQVRWLDDGSASWEPEHEIPARAVRVFWQCRLAVLGGRPRSATSTVASRKKAADPQ